MAELQNQFPADCGMLSKGTFPSLLHRREIAAQDAAKLVQDPADQAIIARLQEQGYGVTLRKVEGIAFTCGWAILAHRVGD